MNKLIWAAVFATSAGWADPSANRGFTVDFSQCTEFAGVGPVDFARASALVPSSFTTLPAGSTTAVVVRATSFTGAMVDGQRAGPTIISQVGIEFVPPVRSRDMNNYTL